MPWPLNGGKMAKIHTLFMTETAEKQYPLGPTYLYSQHTGVPPSPGIKSTLNIYRVWTFSVTVPNEIKARGPAAKIAFENALKIGKVKVYRARVMLIGPDRAGKTSLKKSLLGMPFNPEELSTVGIEVDPSSFEIDTDQVKNWRHTEEKLGLSQFAPELAKMAAIELENKEAQMELRAQEVPKDRRSHVSQADTCMI